MKFLTYTRACILFTIFLIAFYLFWTRTRYVNVKQKVGVEVEVASKKSPLNDYTKYNVYLAVVACGDRLHETLNMLKSALMFSKVKLNFVVFAEESLIESFAEKVLIDWKY